MVEDNWKNEWVKAVDANGNNYACNGEQVKKINASCSVTTGSCNFSTSEPAPYPAIVTSLNSTSPALKCFSNQDCRNYIPNAYCEEKTGAAKATCHGAFKPQACDQDFLVFDQNGNPVMDGSGNQVTDGMACSHDPLQPP